jgi:hypothetical protein
MNELSIQECYAARFSHCFGCGQSHPTGLHLRSYLVDNGQVAICHTTPPDEYTGGVPDNLYGGFIASLFDCHGTASAAGFYLVSKGKPLSPDTLERFITAHLEVDFLSPTPMGQELTLKATPIEVTDRKAILEMTLSVGERTTARAKMVAVKCKF